jgi:hypothetical protein
MKKHVALSLATLLAVLLIDSHVDLVERDQRKLLLVNGRLHDTQGWLSEAVNRLTRRCDRVQAPDSVQGAALVAAVRAHSPPDSSDALLVQAWYVGDWAIAELSFSRLKPTVVLLQQQAGWQVHPQAIWSGSTAPWRVNDFVRRFLHMKAPGVPTSLLACLDLDPSQYTAQHAPMIVSGQVTGNQRTRPVGTSNS